MLSNTIVGILVFAAIAQVQPEKIDFNSIFHTPTKDYDKLEILERSSFEKDPPTAPPKTNVIPKEQHPHQHQPKAIANAQVLFNFPNEAKDKHIPHSNNENHHYPIHHGYPQHNVDYRVPTYPPVYPTPLIYPYHPYHVGCYCVPPPISPCSCQHACQCNQKNPAHVPYWPQGCSHYPVGPTYPFLGQKESHETGAVPGGPNKPTYDQSAPSYSPNEKPIGHHGPNYRPTGQNRPTGPHGPIYVTPRPPHIPTEKPIGQDGPNYRPSGQNKPAGPQGPHFETPRPHYETPRPHYETPRPHYETPGPSYGTSGPSYIPNEKPIIHHGPNYRPSGQNKPEGLHGPHYETPRPSYETPRPSYETPRPNHETPGPNYQTPGPLYIPGEKPSGPFGPNYRPIGQNKPIESQEPSNGEPGEIYWQVDKPFVPHGSNNKPNHKPTGQNGPNHKPNGPHGSNNKPTGFHESTYRPVGPSGPNNKPNKPTGGNNKPNGGNNKPNGANNKPNEGSYNPNGSNNKPSGGQIPNHRPAGQNKPNNKPNGGNNKPHGGNYNPTGGNHNQNGANNKPGGVQRPNNKPSGPNSPNNKPHGGNYNQNGGNNKPTGGNNKPSGAQTPNNKPSGQNRPNNRPDGGNYNQNRPNNKPNGSQQPNKPNVGNYYPNGPNNQPGGSQKPNNRPSGQQGPNTKPNGGNYNPNGANNKPNGANNKPNGANNKPNGANNKPNGANNKPSGAQGPNLRPSGQNRPNNKPNGGNYNPNRPNNKPSGSGNPNYKPSGQQKPNNKPTGGNYPSGPNKKPSSSPRPMYRPSGQSKPQNRPNRPQEENYKPVGPNYKPNGSSRPQGQDNKPNREQSGPNYRPTGQEKRPTFRPTDSPAHKTTTCLCKSTLRPGRPIIVYDTQKPTQKPITTSTYRPTNKPTNRPNKPTSRPNKPNNGANKPNNRPNQPTNRPYKPTSRPTNRVTYGPTTKPTYKPTHRPTNKPTYRPTYKPTNRPTNKPTYRPTNKPTYRPTNKPTNRPTPRPTYRPTGTPRRPTNKTFKPTNTPTYGTTKRPTYRPEGTTGRPVTPPYWTQAPTRPVNPTYRPVNPTYRPDIDQIVPQSQYQQAICKELLNIIEAMLRYLVEGGHTCTIEFTNKEKQQIADALGVIVKNLKENDYNMDVDYKKYDKSGILDSVLPFFPFNLLLQKHGAGNVSQRESLLMYIKKNYPGTRGHQVLDQTLKDKIVDLFLENFNMPHDQIDKMITVERRDISDVIKNYLTYIQEPQCDAERFWRELPGVASLEFTRGPKSTEDLADVFTSLISQVEIPHYIGEEIVQKNTRDDLIDSMVKGLFGAQSKAPVGPPKQYTIAQHTLKKVKNLFLCQFAQRLIRRYPHIGGLNNLLVFCKNGCGNLKWTLKCKPEPVFLQPDFSDVSEYIRSGFPSDSSSDTAFDTQSDFARSKRGMDDAQEVSNEQGYRILTSDKPLTCLSCSQGLPNGKFPVDMDAYNVGNVQEGEKEAMICPCGKEMVNGVCPSCPKYTKELNDMPGVEDLPSEGPCACGAKVEAGVCPYCTRYVKELNDI